jgi:hypothetical protein
MKFEKNLLDTNAKAVLIEPVKIAVYSGSIFLNEGNPSIKM